MRVLEISGEYVFMNNFELFEFSAHKLTFLFMLCSERKNKK